MINAPKLATQDEQRRLKTRRQHWNGLDYLEVEVDGSDVFLRVYFMGKAPQQISEQNVLIRGGRRVRSIRAVHVDICRVADQEQEDCLTIYLDRPGDFSTYTLCLVEVDESGRPIQDGTFQGQPRYRPLEGFDPRYACLDFSFQAGCPSEMDCQAAPVCPPDQREEPEINYLVKDFASFRRLILDRLAIVMPDWKERHIPDLGVALVDLFAYAGDYLSYYQDAVATEAYLDTARLRVSVRRHARLVDYILHEGCNARAWVFVKADDAVLKLSTQDFSFASAHTSLPAENRVLAETVIEQSAPGDFTLFEPLPTRLNQVYSFVPSHNEICIYTWGDRQCCLPRGSTAASLTGPLDPPLLPGDFLLFEEVLGPQTGAPEDADPSHRHVVQLTEVVEDEDPLNGQKVIEVAWAAVDALPFPLCVSAVGRAPECAYLEGISVARGNLVLVDQGCTVEEDLEVVPGGQVSYDCIDEGQARRTIQPARYRPALKDAPLTYAQPLDHARGAVTLLQQDPRQALPGLLSLTDQWGGGWQVQPDLLASGPDDPHVVIEMDDDGRAHLRFGDDELGKRPEPGTSFHARYRQGSGPQGNVGAGAIAYLIFHGAQHPNTGLWPRNPFPAVGGQPAEPLAQAKLNAPVAFRKTLRRAITAGDYAAIVMRDFAGQVQRAAATLRWNGAWYEVLVAVDQLGGMEPSGVLLAEIQHHLRRYRRIGHDVVVRPAEDVPLDVSLTVCVKPDYLRGHVAAAVLSVLSNGVLPGGGQGFFHPDRLTFGQAVYLSPLVAAVSTVPGVESVQVTRFERSGNPDGQAIENGFLPLGPLEIARLDNDPSYPENGRLQLDVRGGR